VHVVGLRFHFRVPNVQSDLLALIVVQERNDANINKTIGIYSCA
jgi:hypothetical protein